MSVNNAANQFRTGLPAIRRHALILVACLIALCILALDLNQSLDGAIAVLYVAVILIVAPLGGRYVIACGIVSVVLSALAFLFGHLQYPTEGAFSRFVVSLVAIGITTLLSLRDRSTRITLSEQARILELSHDTVIIRGIDDVILYWNEGAEQLYGWSRDEAIGSRCDVLLATEIPETGIYEVLHAAGQWSGEIVRSRRDGTHLVLASRWLLRRDPEGKAVGIIESSSDMTERRKADSQRLASEGRFRAIFDSAGFAMWESDWSATLTAVLDGAPASELRTWLASRPDLVRTAVGAAVIRNANQAASDLFGAASRETLMGGNLCARYVDADVGALVEMLASLADGASSAEAEVTLLTFSDRPVDLVLRVTLLPEGESWSHVLVMAFDVTDRNHARMRFEKASSELAHAGRVSMLGQLAASIAHEVNQPLTAIINYAKSAGRWIAHAEPRIDEVQKCLGSIVTNGTRAAEVISRVRSLSRKAGPQAEEVDLVELIEGALAITRREAAAQNVPVIWSRPESPPPPVWADRVQIQQVLVNLIINGIQAMATLEGAPRELCIETEETDEGDAAVYVRDCGMGFAEGGEERIFEPFFTTKPEGMGMGLSICRSIIEAGGGAIWAQNNQVLGATVAFRLPARVVVERTAVNHI